MGIPFSPGSPSRKSVQVGAQNCDASNYDCARQRIHLPCFHLEGPVWPGGTFSLTSLIKDPLFHVFGSSACSFTAFFVSFRAEFSFVFWRLLLILKDFFGSFRLNSIFFAFLANSPPPAGRFQTHSPALSSGHLHRSTQIGYHIPVFASSAKMQEQECGSQKAGTRQQRWVEAQQKQPRRVRPLVPMSVKTREERHRFKPR